MVVEAHPVDQRLIGGQAEEPGAWVSRLSLGSHGAHLDKAKTECGPGWQSQPIFVHASGQAEWVGKAQPKELPLQLGAAERKELLQGLGHGA